ncbi:laminin subunit alpha-1 isoform X2 [Cimex lectularius]|uniref:Laminin subunit alpha-1 n=1 Tax=Cimex lectularius TaxID=79782 RepID=A0A8I6RR93_CIMLE|nr:laminin subunit alpha-1 isoform X2 [Cimex lectularius]
MLSDLYATVFSFVFLAGVSRSHQKHGGLFPEPVDLAVRGSIWSNGTCGEQGPETFCKLSRGTRPRDLQCGVCDAKSHDKRHPPEYAIDHDSDTWWQSSTLHNGHHNQRVTVTIDLKQVYQVLHIGVRAGPSPRPGNWILERSIDGKHYMPWQYFATNGDECLSKYGIKPSNHHLTRSRDQVPCTTAYSKVSPVEGGEIHVSLTQGWVNSTFYSPEVVEFTKARFVRLSLQKMSSSKTRHVHGSELAKKFYYTIKDILIQGRCHCNGHASKCKHDPLTGEAFCECLHKTTGMFCDECLPLYNQRPWKAGTLKEANPCLKCECNGHADACQYDSGIDTTYSHDGRFLGGGVCLDCQDHTTGVNCEMCEDGWYRPSGVLPNATNPCRPCDCPKDVGSNGLCYKDDSEIAFDRPAGGCICAKGFTGLKCDRCAPGYSHYPFCYPCNCDPRGWLAGSSCEKSCKCKPNVTGEFCEKCQLGFFFLDRDGTVDCRECYCSGVSNSCERALGYSVNEFMSMDKWQVCDLQTSYIVQPHTDPKTNHLLIGDYQMSGIDSYYWMAPLPYRGNKLTSYGSAITFSLSWDIMRGDTSGKATKGPDIVLIGQNGLRIGYGNSWHHERSMNITVPLVEDGWYYVLDTYRDYVTRLRRNHMDVEDFKGEYISREQLLSVLADIKHLLIRAKFHTDQAEGSLLACIMEIGYESGSGSSIGFIEKCDCPPGNIGLSCEQCDFGYTKVTDGIVPVYKVVCSKCNCHNHAATCDATTGQCGKCEHHTTGPLCESCMDGYYGDATKGTHTDCRRCACPLIHDQNNFSPTCKADSLDYVCTDCPEGYSGRHCESCAPGFFGNPEERGSTCKPCNCSGGPCDTLKGHCLTCHGNTHGLKCDKCKDNHYGDPHYGCYPCDCNEIGSEEKDWCDSETGQCKCKEKFYGRTCDRCQTGFGNVSAECLPCQCDSVGAKSSLCDSITGACDCLPGVTGQFCDSCFPEYYGYSSDGCKKCDCDTNGSESRYCDLETGECTCKQHVIGRMCNKCESGYWGLSLVGCVSCDCDPLGSKSISCDLESGQCYCKPGVGGLKCDQCMPKYFNMSSEGCSECEVCNQPGKICDPDTGRCVCPPFTTGITCERCEQHSWGYHPTKGCKPCDCDLIGSYGRKCDPITGKCSCREGYQGDKCQNCVRGYFGLGSCKRCACNIAGTQPQHCHDGICVCDVTGQCPCKDNVFGLQCNQCKDGTFGLREDNPEGCTECFCFGRSAKCRDAGLIWGSIRMNRPRILMVNYDNQTSPNNVIIPVDTKEICYINLAIPGNGGMVKKDARHLNITNNLRIIPGDEGNVEMGVNYLVDAPVYWQLPKQFLGDKLLSYGGFLHFTVESDGEHNFLPHSILTSYPLLQIQGNGKLVLEHFPIIPYTSGHHQVRLHESLWRMKNNPEDVVSREKFMIALQNLQHILIRASGSVGFTETRIRDVSLDTAVPREGNKERTVTGIEICECPRNYNSSSCQDPSIGFYRSKPAIGTASSTIIIELVGEAKPCECNNRSNICDMETGFCKSCLYNTGGRHCDTCAEGFYGDPIANIECLPCPCPTIFRNNAIGCEVYPDDERICYCKEGYTGKYCNRCSYGWFGNPEAGGTCKKCMCNSLGRLDEACDEKSGQCTCINGVTGWDCSKCIDKMHILTEYGCKECTDSCITSLLSQVNEISTRLHNDTYNLLTGTVSPPREPLVKLQNRANELERRWVQTRDNLHLYNELNELLDKEMKVKEKNLHNKIKKLLKPRKHQDSIQEVRSKVFQLKPAFDSIENELSTTKKKLMDVIKGLRNYVERDDEKISTSAMILEAKRILSDIRDKDLQSKRIEAKRILRCCNNSLNDLNFFGDRHEIELLYNRLDELKMKIKDMDKWITDTIDKHDMIQELNVDNQNIINTLKKRINDIEMTAANIKNIMNSTDYMAKVARVYLDELTDDILGIENERVDLKSQNKKVKDLISNVLTFPNLEETVSMAENHAANLMNYSEYYRNVFKTDAGVAMEASKAYDNIAKSVAKAYDAALNATTAAKASYEKAHPNNESDSLLGQSLTSKKYSQELHSTAKQKLKDIIMFKSNMDKTQGKLDTIMASTDGLGHELDIVHKHVDEMEGQLNSIKNIAIKAADKCDEVIEASEDRQDEILELNHNLITNLKTTLHRLEVEDESNMNTARDLIDRSRENTKKIQDFADQMTSSYMKYNEDFEKWNDTISSKLEALRNKITQAHHIANSIRLSMTSIGDNSGSCVRTYQPTHLEPSTMTSVILTYAISSQLRDALLFYLPSSTSEDFVAIEMVNRKMRFAWNVGGGLGEVIHPLHIQTAGDLHKDQHWYRVEAERVSNIGHLKVRPVVVPEGSQLADKPPATNASAPGVGRLDVGPGDRIWVGGADRRHPHLLSTQSGLVGCLHQLFLNGRPIGLWDFSTQNPNSCTACVEGAQEIKDESSYGFSGDGYVVLKPENSGIRNKYLFSVSLRFKTFDSNALLFLGIENSTDRYLSLSLQDGHAVFHISYGQYSSLEMTTVEQYNNGVWHHIEASRFFDRMNKLEKGILKVGSEVRDGAPTVPPNQDIIPDLTVGSYYIGGVPPGEVNNIKNLAGSYLGCMSDIQIDQGGYSLLKNNYWGIQAPCSKKPITVAGFLGNGFLELPSHDLKKKDNFGFVFSTMKRDALLMLSTFEGLDRQSYYSVSLRRGQIDVRINAGKGEVRLASISSEYADSQFHSVSVTKSGRKLELRVNDKLDAKTVLPDGSNVVKAPGEKGGLYFGGLPAGFNTTGRTFSNMPFVGTIKDVIFNDKVFGFDKPKQFKRVTIGRFGPNDDGLDNEKQTGVMGCRKVSSYSLEPGALRFGDKLNSHVQINLRSAVVQNNFSIGIDFRTFYPNGLLFIIPGGKGHLHHYLMASLKNGRVQVVLKGSRRIHTKGQAVFNDGLWHRMVVEKSEKKLYLKVDTIDTEWSKMTKKTSIGKQMFIGGVAENGVMIPNKLFQKIEGFKGCIRNLKINYIDESLISDKTTHHGVVDQCFPNVERGSYFPGDGYAIYKNKFNIGSLLEFEMEFRTSEMNGILLSVSEPHGYPALSLELHNGKIVMSGDMGDRRPFTVTQEFATEFTACDNKWHSVQVIFVKDKLILMVDNLKQTYWLSDNGHLTEAWTNSPLYIGGIPENASMGTLQSRENFRGCIRNVIISRERKDWTAMAALHSILLSSCPLAD